MIDVYAGEEWLGAAPEIPEPSIGATVESDVVVVGAGLAGVAATRQAADEGATVTLLEKCTGVQCRGGDFAILDGRVAERWGWQTVDKVQVVTDLMKDMCYKVSQPILRRWAERAGASFDWYLEGLPGMPVLGTSLEPAPRDATCWVRPRRHPAPASFDNARERFKCYQVTAFIQPTHVHVLRGNLALAEATGRVQTLFSTRARKLVRADEGRVEGVIARGPSGADVLFRARRGVVLATGDYMSDNRMLRRFCPELVNTPQLWFNYDEEGNASNTGDGHKMGMWIGAKMQDAAPAPSAHHMGGVFGACGFLLLNSRGERFVNEDAPGQQIGDQLENLPDKLAWQLVDGGWPEQVPNGYPSHGSVCYVAADADLAVDGKLSDRLPEFLNVVSPGLVSQAVEAGTLLRADTLDELIAKMGLPVAQARASIARYNELCARGHDEDFGKTPRRLFPVARPPFYATRFTPAILIFIAGGLQSDEEARCYDHDGRSIPGLYVAGNVQGNRFAVEYPLTVPGISHSMALTYGRIAGTNVVRGA